MRASEPDRDEGKAGYRISSFRKPAGPVNRYDPPGTRISNRAPVPGYTGLPDPKTGDIQDFTCQTKAEAAVPPISAFKDVVLSIIRYANTIIFYGQGPVLLLFVETDTDLAHMLPVAPGIIEEAEKNPFKEGVGEYFEPAGL